MAKAIIKKLIISVILLSPVKVFGDSDLALNEKLFESVCKNYDMIGSSIKCETDLYKVEIPLIYKHELIRPNYASNSKQGIYINSQ